MARRAKGEGTITENKDRGRWEGRIELPPGPDGKRKRRMVTGRTKKDVAEKLASIKAELAEGVVPPSEQLTVGQYLDHWVANVLPGTVAKRTEDNYGEIVRLYIKPTVGRRKLRDLTPDDVTYMLRCMESRPKTEAEARAAGNPLAPGPKPLSTNTQRLARSILRRALRRAQQQGTIVRNVAAIADGPKVDAKAGRTMTPEQARTLLQWLEGTDDRRIHRARAAWVVMLSLGLRRGELLGLAWPDVVIDGEKFTLNVVQTLKRTYGAGLVLDAPKAKQSRRRVVLPPPVAKALRTHRDEQADEREVAGAEWVDRPLEHDLIFRTPFGTALDPDNFKHMTYKATKLALGEKWTPHELRHSAASILIAQGVPLKIISEVLGHSSIRITADVYGHLMEPSELAAQAMNDALWEA